MAKMVRERYNGGILGNWRMEVSPGSQHEEDVFLHLIQVGDNTLTEMGPAELIENDDMVGVQFSFGKKNVMVSFAKKGEPSGHITISSEGKKLIDRDLSGEVIPQAGLSGGQ